MGIDLGSGALPVRTQEFRRLDPERSEKDYAECLETCSPMRTRASLLQNYSCPPRNMRGAVLSSCSVASWNIPTWLASAVSESV
eukprot:5238567-Amphidinium_carterae.1